MAYIPHTTADTAAMLKSIGAAHVDDLFSDVPARIQLREPLKLPTLNETELSRLFEEAAADNDTVPGGRNFLGAGAYRHFIPAAVKHLITRGEFMTCYTPYQAEVSQGTLQCIYEFQSHIASLTGLDVANASMYDGATALAEAITMAARHNGNNVVWLPELLHPHYRAVCETFLREIDIEVRTIPSDGVRSKYAEVPADAACAVVVQTPNALGVIADVAGARAAADRCGGLLIAVVNPTSLAVLASPASYGADVAVGEAQPIGIPVSFGGPWAGFFACKNEFLRKMPGRLAGKTHDVNGREGYVLTLQTREQHIRRAKATSNICTNQGLFALMVTMYLTFLGREGLVEVAETCMARTQQLVAALTKGTAIKQQNELPYFHEAALKLPMNAEDFVKAMRREGKLIAGFPLQRWLPQFADASNLLLVNCTEQVTAADIAHYVKTAKSVLAAK